MDKAGRFQFDVAMLLALTTVSAVAIGIVGPQPTRITVLAGLLVLLVAVSVVGLCTTSGNTGARASWVTFSLGGLAPTSLALILIPVAQWVWGGRFPEPHVLHQYRAGLMFLWAYLLIAAGLAVVVNRFVDRRESDG